MTGLSIESISSYVRDLSSSCSTVRIFGNSLLAGSHDGLLVSWDTSSGIEKWRASIAGPISDISLDSDIIYVTASDSLHAIDHEKGSILWRKQLEGASDYVFAVDGIVWATSSVYELEVADFIEATIWRFDRLGNELGRWGIAERPWHIASDGSDGILLGLGRPRCGYVRISSKLGIEHIQLSSNSPVTCGSGNDTELIFGHADGSVSALKDSILEAKSLVTSIALGAHGWISGHEDGSISMKAKSEILPGSIDSVEIDETIGWASSFDGLNVQIMIIGEESNTISHDSRVRQMDSSTSGIVLGDDQGRVYFVESGVMQRRLDSQLKESEYDSKSSELRARLRMLRNR